jgi:phenylacetate-CoA ligase
LDFYDPKEGMSRGEREECYRKKVVRVVKNAYKNTAAARDKMDRAGVSPDDIKSVKDLEKIPISRKAELPELQRRFGVHAFRGVPVGKLRRLSLSPGPIYDVGIFDPELVRVATKSFYAGGFRKGDIVMNTFSYHLLPGAPYLDDALTRLGAVVVASGTAPSEQQVQAMHDFGVTGMVSTPDFPLALIKRAESMGYDFRRDFALKRLEIYAGMFPPSLRKVYEGDYGITTHQTYSTGEWGTYAYECHLKNGMHIAEEVFMEVVDPATGKQLGPGEIGELVATPLIETYPILRFGTEDLSYVTDKPCPCGRTSPRMVRILGRTSDSVKLRGIFVHPHEVDEVIAKMLQISRFQVVVERRAHRDYTTYKVELASEEVNREELKATLVEKLRSKVKIRPDEFEFVSRGTIPEGEKSVVDRRSWE